jgi:hypothetical protein
VTSHQKIEKIAAESAQGGENNDRYEVKVPAVRQKASEKDKGLTFDEGAQKDASITQMTELEAVQMKSLSGVALRNQPREFRLTRKALNV